VVDFDGKNYVVYIDGKILTEKIMWSIVTENSVVYFDRKKILWSILTEKLCGPF